jgi:hypothetical protein
MSPLSHASLSQRYVDQRIWQAQWISPAFSPPRIIVSNYYAPGHNDANPSYKVGHSKSQAHITNLPHICLLSHVAVYKSSSIQVLFYTSPLPYKLHCTLFFVTYVLDVTVFRTRVYIKIDIAGHCWIILSCTKLGLYLRNMSYKHVVWCCWRQFFADLPPICHI